MVHPDTTLAFVSDTVGYGVVATRRIPRGTVVWVQDGFDQTFSPDAFASMPEVMRTPVERYAYRDHRGDMVLCWDLAKYFNHSCASSCLGLDFPFEIAVRDIEVGEQLTDDYGTFYLLSDERFTCHCGAPSCRGQVTASDRQQHLAAWVARLADALREVGQVEQPLAELLPAGAIEDVQRRYGAASVASRAVGA